MELLIFISKLFWNILATAGKAFWVVARPLMASKSVLLSVPRSIGYTLAGMILSVLEMMMSVFRVTRRSRGASVEMDASTGSPSRWVPSYGMRHNLQVAMAMTVIIGCYGWLIVWAGLCYFGGPKEDVRAAFGAGQRAAAETASLLPGGGEVVVVTWKTGMGRDRMPQEKAQLAGFKQILGIRPQLHLAGIERVGLDQADERTGRMAGVFFDILQRHPEANAVVSFVGVPDMEPSEIQKLGGALPAFVVVTAMRESALDPFFRQNLLTVAIIPRREPVTGDDEPGERASSYECFDRAYTVIHPEPGASRTGGG